MSDNQYSGPPPDYEFAKLVHPRRKELKRIPKFLAPSIIARDYPDAGENEIAWLTWLIGQEAGKRDLIEESSNLSLFYAALHTAGAANAALARHNRKTPQSMSQRLNRFYNRYGKVPVTQNVWSDAMIEVAYREYLDMLDNNPLLHDTWNHIELGEELWKRASGAIAEDNTPDEGSAQLL